MIYGVGVNDAGYQVSYYDDGICTWRCPFYTVWKSMLVRCYSEKYHSKQPTYIGCIVCDEWLTFSSFKYWMETQDWEDKQLDKDILGNGKLYSPETCCFVPRWLNNLFRHQKNATVLLPLGVTKCNKKFKAQLVVNGTCTYLGLYQTAEEAHNTYLSARKQYVTDKIYDLSDDRVIDTILEKLDEET